LKEQLTIFLKGGGFAYLSQLSFLPPKNTGDGVGDTSALDSTLNFIDDPQNDLIS